MLSPTLSAYKWRAFQFSVRHITVRKWRQQRGLHPLRTAVGPLTDMPDWSFMDGRGYGPPTVGQKERYIRNEEIARDVIKYHKQLQIAKKLVPDDVLKQ